MLVAVAAQMQQDRNICDEKMKLGNLLVKYIGYLTS